MNRSHLGKALFQASVADDVLRRAEDGLKDALAAFVKMFREAREANGITLRAAAKSLRISSAYLSDIELSRRPPGVELREKMMRIIP